jgi:quercetin dioxygenase-like cupin family protein
MRVVRASEGTTNRGTTFTGETWQTRLLPEQEPDGTTAGVVRFEDGSRTNWHIHPGEQVLYILEGEGRVGTATEEQQVGPGDIVVLPARQRHWHGAAAGKHMTHLAVSLGGAPEWFEAPE